MKFLQIITLSFLTLFMLRTDLTAQTPMVKGASVAQVGIGLGGWGTGTLYGSATPVISLGYELGIMDDLGPGNLAVGATVGYQSAKYFNTSIYNWKYSWTFAAVRASWHPHFINSEELDVYIALNLGFYLFRVNGDNVIGNSSSISPAYAGTLGARYYFTDNLGVWAEIGAGIAWLTAGLCLTF